MAIYFILVKMSGDRTKNTFVIRNLRNDDFKDIVDNFYDRYREIRVNPTLGVGLYKKKPTIKEEKRWFSGRLKQIRSRNAFVSIAELDGKVVGMCDVFPPKPTTDYLHIGHLGISIKDGYRSMGIGTALLCDALKKSRGRYRIIVLEVFRTNKQAIRLYKRFGFKIYGNLPGGVVRGKLHTDRIFMYLRV
jgi:ribosomal-protein-alanine N-acetyltransferase